MRMKSNVLVLAMTGALVASGAVLAQERPGPGMDINAPPVPPVGPTLPGTTCTGSGGTNCNLTAPPAFNSTIPIVGCPTIMDVNIGADVSAPWSGDIQLTVTGPSGTSVEIVPGGDGGGCPTPDMYTVLDDDSTVLVTTFCAGVPPGIEGVLRPAQALAAFNGELGTGTWTLGVSDDFPALDDIELNDWSVQLVCDTNADLQLTKTGPASVTAGTNMTYTFHILNDDGPAGAAAVQNAVLTDSLPAGVTLVSSTGGICAPVGGSNITCNVGAIAAGGDTTFDMTVAVAASVPAGTVLTNDAMVTSEVNDPSMLNNSDSVDVAVEALSPITVTKTQTTANPIVAGSGVALCYAVSITNAGPSNVTGLQVVDSWSAYPGISWSSGGAPCAGGACWTLNINAGQTVNDSICFGVASSAAVGTFTNTLTATGSDNPADNLGDPANHTASVNTAITRVVDIVVTKTGPASVTAGSGAGNLVHTVTVQNLGPSNVTALGINDVITGPASGGVTNVSGTGARTMNLAAGGSTSFNVTGTVTLAAVEGETITNTASVTGSGGGESIVNPGNDSDSATTTIAWPTATFNVSKLYAGGTGPSVNVSLDCSDSTGLGFGAPGATTTDGSMVWRRFDHNTGTTCSVVEVVPPGYYESQRNGQCDVTNVNDGATYNCTLVNEETVARFHVTKDFSDGSTDDVDVTLTCDTGLPLIQTLTIAGGDQTGVTFVVKDFVDGTMSCAVTEVTNTPGYDLDSSDCKWDNVMSIDGPFGCVVNNTAQDATFKANMVWYIENDGGDEVNTVVPVSIGCDSEITTSGSVQVGTNWYLSANLDDGQSLSAKVSTETGPANCWATQTITQSGVESVDDCGSRALTAGSSDSCTFENTVFFEGIPTLSQYGLAILALLTLGVGLVGFRRFV